MDGERLRIGVDLGGTKIEAVLARPRGGGGAAGDLEILDRRRIPTERERGYEAILERAAGLVEAVESAAGGARLPVGIGMPGGVSAAGLVKNSNTTCLNGRPFHADLARRLAPREVRFENDANCFALAEARLGAARDLGARVVFGVILGTGVGGGLVLDGRIWPGRHGIAGEWGHHAVYSAPGCSRSTTDAAAGGSRSTTSEALEALRPCYCGNRGCLETYASGPAVEADYLRRSGEGRPLAAIAARRAEDPHAAAAIEGLLDAFARGLANVVDILDPDVVVLGGGVSSLECLYDEGRERVARLVFNDELRTPVLRPALGPAAGVLGAALLV